MHASQTAQTRPQFSWASPFRAFGGVVDTALVKFFSSLGRVIAKNPIKTIVLSVAFAALCALGLLKLKVNNNAEQLYTPQNNEAFDDRDYVEALYGYPDRDSLIYVTGPNGDGSNILTKPVMLALLDLHQGLLKVQAPQDGQLYTLESSRVCKRPAGPTSPCDIKGPLDWFGYNRTRIEAAGDIAAVFSKPTTDAVGRPLRAEEIFSKVVRTPTGTVVSSEAFKVKISNQNNKGGSASSKVDKVVDAWEKAAVSYVKDFQKNQNPKRAEFIIRTDWEDGEVSGKAITSDVGLLIFGYILLVVYGVLVLSKRHSIFSSAALAFANVGSIALAVLVAYGLGCLFVDFSLVVQVLAVLLLGLGTDDMLVTMSSHDDSYRELGGLDTPVVERVTATVARARRGVIVASLTNFLAFCAGTSSGLPALRDFCIFAAIGVIFVLVFQSTFFVACLAIDVRRQQRRKMDVLCCVTSKLSDDQGCCGRPYNASKPKPTELIIGRWLPRIVLHPVGKVIIIIMSVAMAVLGAIGASQVGENFDLDSFIPDSEPFKQTQRVRDRYFGGNLLPFAVYTKNENVPPLDYFKYQSQLLAISVDLRKGIDSLAKQPDVDSFYEGYQQWLPTSSFKGSLGANGGVATSALFYESLAVFLNTTGARHKDDVIFLDASKKAIKSARINAFFQGLPDSPSQVKAMKQSRRVAKESAPDLGAISYSFPFIFFEGYAVIAHETVREVAVAGACVFVVMLIMLADLVTSVLVGFMVVLVDLELIGLLRAFNLDFNSVTAINMLLAVGIAVDYSAFIGFAFLQAKGSRNTRARLALKSLGVAVFNGGFTLFLAVLPTAGAKSFIFQTFFKMFTGIVVLGLWHGLFLLPVILSFIGSEPYYNAYISEEEEEGDIKKVESAREGTAVTEVPSAQSMGV